MKFYDSTRLKCDNLPKSFYYNVLGYSAGITAILIIIFLIFKDTDVWASYQIYRDLVNRPEYTEKIFMKSIFRTRFNTWSNLAFVFSGIGILGLASVDSHRKHPLSSGYLGATPAQSLLAGLTFIYLGIGSGFFHASLSRIGQQCDVGAMFAVSLSLVLVSVGSWFPYIKIKKKSYSTALFIVSVGLIGSILLTIFKWHLPSGELLYSLIGALIVFIIADFFHPRKKMQIRWALLAFATLFVAIQFRTADVHGGFWPGHSIWHVLLACYLYFIYLYHRSEERI